jgi:hypothetical protein
MRQTTRVFQFNHFWFNHFATRIPEAALTARREPAFSRRDAPEA